MEAAFPFGFIMGLLVVFWQTREKHLLQSMSEESGELLIASRSPGPAVVSTHMKTTGEFR